MKIAILGGSFDPPHIGHFLIAQQVKDFLKMDQVWLMPNYSHAFGKTQTLHTHRLKMTSFLKSNKIEVSDIEIKKQGISYTADTLYNLTNKYPRYELFWILGSDQLESFQKYNNWQEIVNNYKLIVFPREYIVSELNETVKKSF